MVTEELNAGCMLIRLATLVCKWLPLIDEESECWRRADMADSRNSFDFETACLWWHNFMLVVGVSFRSLYGVLYLSLSSADRSGSLSLPPLRNVKDVL